MRALGGHHGDRVASLPDVPTVGESVPGFEISTWQGIGAPKATPAEIVAALNKEINAGLADPKVKARIIAARRRAVADLDRGVREARGRGNGAMGQGDPRGQDSAAVNLSRAALIALVLPEPAGVERARQPDQRHRRHQQIGQAA